MVIKNKIGLFLFISAFAFAQQEIYVSVNNGNDSNNGSEQSPYKTINRGIQDVIAGGTVYVMNGIYRNENASTPIVSFYEDSSQQDSAKNNYVYSNGENLNNPHVVTINKSGNETDGYITLKNYQNHQMILMCCQRNLIYSLRLSLCSFRIYFKRKDNVYFFPYHSNGKY